MRSSNCAKGSQDRLACICICTSKSCDTKWLLKFATSIPPSWPGYDLLLIWNNLEGIVRCVKIKEVREITQNDETKSLLGSRSRTSYATEYFWPEAVGRFETSRAGGGGSSSSTQLYALTPQMFQMPFNFALFVDTSKPHCNLTVASVSVIDLWQCISRHHQAVLLHNAS